MSITGFKIFVPVRTVGRQIKESITEGIKALLLAVWVLLVYTFVYGGWLVGGVALLGGFIVLVAEDFMAGLFIMLCGIGVWFCLAVLEDG